ncbi:FHA domain-containing protein FhaB/FipA [Corynebacterium sphenisci]|uniref:FHA domain-containing protein FhaB/FipA n=1 Tax=Corynebacterium sphenisci TaxID=191493 RepID=UPI0026DFF96C|nr:FHA domain-containing protein [Corynebacterium sphenisci]MDO5731018.1 FHA domain-containing protein [Corynebacterium sphenisci]
MEAIVFLLSRIAVLVLLWFFIWMTMRGLRADANAASGLRPVRAAAPAVRARPFQRAQTPHQLLVTAGPLAGSRMNLDNSREVTIGRADDSAFVLDDDYASARHARLLPRDGDWFLEDLDSRNGTFLNGQRVDAPEKLETGMEIRIGRTTLRLQP